LTSTYCNAPSDSEVNAAMLVGEKLPRLTPTRFGKLNDVSDPFGAAVSL
jgi:hypothetical protein